MELIMCRWTSPLPSATKRKSFECDILGCQMIFTMSVIIHIWNRYL